MKTVFEWIKVFLDRLQTTNPKWFRVIMVICALVTFFVLGEQQFDFVDLGKIELEYDHINYFVWFLFGFSWLPNNDEPKKIFPNLFK